MVCSDQDRSWSGLARVGNADRAGKDTCCEDEGFHFWLLGLPLLAGCARISDGA
jgi:hypothetical protein